MTEQQERKVVQFKTLAAAARAIMLEARRRPPGYRGTMIRQSHEPDGTTAYEARDHEWCVRRLAHEWERGKAFVMWNGPKEQQAADLLGEAIPLTPETEIYHSVWKPFGAMSFAIEDRVIHHAIANPALLSFGAALQLAKGRAVGVAFDRVNPDGAGGFQPTVRLGLRPGANPSEQTHMLIYDSNRLKEPE